MLVPLGNDPRPFDWGSTTLIAQLEGRPEAAQPEAEVWFGDHAADAADVRDGSGRTLDEWIRQEGVEVGPDGRLPYLLKILAAEKSLSIQAHPTKRQAEEGFAAERDLPDSAPRNYTDDNHKPEMIVALRDGFVALCGLRDIEATARLLAQLGDAAAPLAARIRDDASLADAIAWLLSGDAQPVVDAIIAALDAARSVEFAPDLANARRNAAQFPGDPGVVVGLLMNIVTLARGEALFLRAGQLHAYQWGIGIEIMAASDNVMRGGLTPKHIDAGELMTVLERRSGSVPVVRAQEAAEAPGFVEYPSDAPDFRLLAARVSGSDTARLEPSGTAIVLCTAGRVSVAAGEAAETLDAGRAVLVTTGEALVEVSGDGEVFVAQPGA
ncbi:mannose-6-phosphate isomerase, class I [Microbacterium faecale]|uniref:mannose-6-phosphate isomerase n=1 Tax=Microbacterium faecale TaxID=1804630 RepID=A0A916Y937_9MICO|nr:mannose-6-phosphate isomerase, class I [Microbacterium faecale]GGD35364.1 mannose-6-phosphate isomerase, class I [Microbacterium faecale]